MRKDVSSRFIVAANRFGLINSFRPLGPGVGRSKTFDGPSLPFRGGIDYLRVRYTSVIRVFAKQVHG